MSKRKSYNFGKPGAPPISHILSCRSWNSWRESDSLSPPAGRDHYESPRWENQGLFRKSTEDKWSWIPCRKYTWMIFKKIGWQPTRTGTGEPLRNRGHCEMFEVNMISYGNSRWHSTLRPRSTWALQVTELFLQCAGLPPSEVRLVTAKQAGDMCAPMPGFASSKLNTQSGHMAISWCSDMPTMRRSGEMFVRLM